MKKLTLDQHIRYIYNKFSFMKRELQLPFLTLQQLIHVAFHYTWRKWPSATTLHVYDSPLHTICDQHHTTLHLTKVTVTTLSKYILVYPPPYPTSYQYYVKCDSDKWDSLSVLRLCHITTPHTCDLTTHGPYDPPSHPTYRTHSLNWYMWSWTNISHTSSTPLQLTHVMLNQYITHMCHPTTTSYKCNPPTTHLAIVAFHYCT